MHGMLRAGTPIQATDVDGRVRVLNAKNQVTVILYSNQSVQDQTRAAGKSVDSFQGLENFRSVVLVDLRSSLANWAPGYAQRRMIRDLDREAERIHPFYLKNGSRRDSRLDVSAVADFKGDICHQLGWEKPTKTMRVLVFDLNGAEAGRWEDLKDYRPLQELVGTLLGKKIDPR
ncbi:MAG: hypothetical protein PHD76_00375 [Methylacidiphilales bacterium]|nr:hypothetical protein [Candidatus Methylacidiphilales bacterium]